MYKHFLHLARGSKKVLKDNEIGLAYPGAKDSFILTEEQIEEKNFLRELFVGIASDLPFPKKK